MPSRLRDRLGSPAIVISIIALVFAMMGGAFAASGALTGKQKKEVEKIAKKSGKPGPAGATGAAGSQGPKGDPGPKGDAGSAGSEGKEGKSVVIAAAKLNECVDRGGINVKVKEEAGAGHEVCNGEEGEEGSPWTVNSTLPPGALETGAFSFHGTEAENPNVGGAISFPIQLANAIERPHIHIFGVDDETEFNAACAEGTYAGGFAAPNAAPGEMCIWPNPLENASISAIVRVGSAPSPLEAQEVGPTGGFIYATITGVGGGIGTFAVRGCEGTTGTNACPSP